MKWLVCAHESRRAFVAELERVLPAGTVFLVDDGSLGARGNFLAALDLAGPGPAVHMQDDILLTRGFEAKLLSVVAQYPHSFIQFFSMRQADLTTGSRWEPGANWCMNQCFYVPAGHSGLIKEFFFNGWKDRDKHKAAVDFLVADYLKSRGMKYWLHCPSLVEHRVCRSVIDPRRSSRRQSKTFVP